MGRTRRLFSILWIWITQQMLKVIIIIFVLKNTNQILVLIIKLKYLNHFRCITSKFTLFFVLKKNFLNYTYTKFFYFFTPMYTTFNWCKKYFNNIL